MTLRHLAVRLPIIVSLCLGSVRPPTTSQARSKMPAGHILAAPANAPAQTVLIPTPARPASASTSALANGPAAPTPIFDPLAETLSVARVQSTYIAESLISDTLVLTIQVS